MPTFAHLAHVLAIALFLICTGAAEPASPRNHYEQCWQVLEDLCERNGSTGCADLVKLCGQLLTQHLAEAHRPTKEQLNCSNEQLPVKLRLLNRQKHLEELPKRNPSNGTAISVLLSQKMAPLAEGVGVRILDLTQSGKGRRSAGNAEPAVPPSASEQGDSGRRQASDSELRGMLSPEQAGSYLIPLEKRTGYRPAPSPRRKPYTATVHDYRQSFLESKSGLIVEWLANNERGFRDFLKFWKNLMLYQQRANPSTLLGDG